jgi:3D (Asp-Asp-Asp) domain-containing protein
MNCRMVIGLAGLLLISLCWSASASGAQESATSKSSSEATEKPATAYRLEFSVNEIEDGKKINTRQYSMNLNAGDGNTVKIGTKVPAEGKQGEMQYIDVGTSIWARLKERDGSLLVEVRSEFSNFATPDQANRGNSMPLLRQFQISASTVALPGKPMVVGSVDDPNSKRQFQLEVTVTRLK